MKLNAWINIPFSVLAQDLSNPSEDVLEKMRKLETLGVSNEISQKAAAEYQKYYRSGVIFQIVRKSLQQQDLDEKEKDLLAQYRADSQSVRRTDWKCYWNGKTLIWRDEPYGSSGDASLRYIRKESTQMRFTRRAA